MVNILGSIGPGSRIVVPMFTHHRYIKKLAALREAGKTDEERKMIADLETYWIINIEKCGLKFEIEGRENLPDRSFVIVANHQSYFDIFAILSLMKGRQIGFVAKEELARISTLGKWMKAMRCILIERGNARDALRAINTGAEYVKEGFNMVIFPEGTRSKGGPIVSFKPGALKLAEKARAPIVPVVISGTYKMIEETNKIEPHNTAYLHVLPPIETESLDRKELAELSPKIEAMIKAEYEKMPK
ncbi:MAG: lysophospholipid acyltransferase family protein [Eubacterium sp.]|jgi:1-acyl-sn-glycerol-3-phosphate acyltransferase